MRTKLIILSIAALCLSAAPAMADLPTLQTILNNITVAPNPGVSSVNVNTDMIPDGSDKHWHITATGGSIATVVIEVAGNAGVNTFGVYDITNPSNYVQIFGGGATTASQASLTLYDDGSVFVNFVDTGIDFGSTWFGYYLGTPAATGGGQQLFYSNTALNSDLTDHMLAYQGKDIDTVKIGGLPAGLWTSSEYILAWEDLPLGQSDLDYNDFVVMVESVMVPVPAAVLLGILGLGVAGLKLRKYA